MTLPVGVFPGNRNIPFIPGTTPFSIWVPAAASSLSVPAGVTVSSTPAQAQMFVGNLAWPTALFGAEVPE